MRIDKFQGSRFIIGKRITAAKEIPNQTPVSYLTPANMTVFVEEPVTRVSKCDAVDLTRVPAPELPEVPHAHNALREAAMSVDNTNGVVTDPFKLSSQFAYTPRKVKVFTIGAGFSGLLMAHKFQHRFPEMREIVEHTIFEARADVGGTWLANHYPGVQCDVPAHIYVSTRFLAAHLSTW